MPLAAETISFAYRPRRPVFEGLTLAFRPGRVAALVGPNGSGKSTLLHLLAGVIRPDRGAVTLGGRPLIRRSAADRARLIAFVAQRPTLAFGFSVRQAVAFGRLAQGGSRAEDEVAVARALEQVGLADRADEPFSTLSVGQQQLGALARALAQLDRDGYSPEQAAARPRFLLADEPTSAMDPKHASATWAILRGLAASGIGVVVAVHDLSAALAVADDAAVLSASGRLAAVGPAEGVLTPDTLGAVFGMCFAVAEVAHTPARALVAVGPSRDQPDPALPNAAEPAKPA